MDPLSALGIAASVTQFTGFALDVLKDYGEIRQNSQPLTFEAFEKTTQDLLGLSTTLKTQPKLARDLASPLAEHEKVMQQQAFPIADTGSLK